MSGEDLFDGLRVDDHGVQVLGVLLQLLPGMSLGLAMAEMRALPGLRCELWELVSNWFVLLSRAGASLFYWYAFLLVCGADIIILELESWKLLDLNPTQGHLTKRVKRPAILWLLQWSLAVLLTLITILQLADYLHRRCLRHARG